MFEKDKYGYQDKDKLCNKCHSGFFRFGAYETWELNLRGKENR